MKSVIAVGLFILILGTQALAGFEEGVVAYEANNLPLAYKEFLSSAEEGHADSQFNIGLMYEQGIGTGKNEAEARAWYLKAAAQGHSNGQFNLAVLFENGRGGPVDFAQANHWYREAAAQGDALAIGNLGMLYLRAQGVEVNQTAGLALLLKSATMDSSPDNHAKQNIAAIRGLTPDIIAAAQSLMDEMDNAQSVLVPLDQYLNK